MNVTNPTGSYAQDFKANAYSTSGDNSDSNSSSSTDNSMVSTNDFLTLLVTQLKNQDPTQPSDPTAYVSQLVGVNSLAQLIDINKQLTSMGGSTDSSTGSTTNS